MPKYPTTKIARVPEPIAAVGKQLLELILHEVQAAVRDAFPNLRGPTDGKLDIRVHEVCAPRGEVEATYVMRHQLRGSFQHPTRGLMWFRVGIDGTDFRLD